MSGLSALKQPGVDRASKRPSLQGEAETPYREAFNFNNSKSGLGSNTFGFDLTVGQTFVPSIKLSQHQNPRTRLLQSVVSFIVDTSNPLVNWAGTTSQRFTTGLLENACVAQSFGETFAGKSGCVRSGFQNNWLTPHPQVVQ